MTTLALIGFVGGLITGISPCILPVLPVIFFSGAQGARVEGAVATAQALRPYLVIAGLVTSFSAVTLVGSALLSLLSVILLSERRVLAETYEFPTADEPVLREAK